MTTKKSTLIGNLKVAQQTQPTTIKSALYEFAQIIMGRAKLVTPVDKGGGELRNSGQVHEPELKGDTYSIVLSFGAGPSRPYALAVHEHLSEHSPPSWVAAEASGKGINWTTTGTGPKYLEKPLNDARPEAATWLAKRIAARNKLGGKG